MSEIWILELVRYLRVAVSLHRLPVLRPGSIIDTHERQQFPPEGVMIVNDLLPVCGLPVRAEDFAPFDNGDVEKSP